MSGVRMTIGQCGTLACLLELSAPKPGNVHRAADFEDATFLDFAASAVALGPILDRAVSQPVGQTIREAVRATREVSGTNTNLGIILLLVPLAHVPRDEALPSGIRRVLRDLTPGDASDVYAAIREADPGGLMPVEHPIDRHDVHDTAPNDLLEAMAAAADRDMIARQYENGFHEVLDVVLPALLDPEAGQRLTDRVILTHVRLMHDYPDSLIRRKGGIRVAEESAARAATVLQLRPLGAETYQRALADLDFWLRSDGNRRNPGTSADLLAAGLFAALRDDLLQPPFR